MSVFIKRKSSEEIEREKLMTDIENVWSMIRNAYDKLNSADNDLLIESIIYELSSLEAKHKYLISLAKSKNFTVNAKRSILVPSIIDYDYSIK